MYLYKQCKTSNIKSRLTKHLNCKGQNVMKFKLVLENPALVEEGARCLMSHMALIHLSNLICPGPPREHLAGRHHRGLGIASRHTILLGSAQSSPPT